MYRLIIPSRQFKSRTTPLQTARQVSRRIASISSSVRSSGNTRPQQLNKKSAASSNPLSADAFILSQRHQQQERKRLQHPRSYSGLPPPQSGSIKFWPFFLMIVLASYGYYALAQKRHDAAQEAVRNHAPHSSPNFPVAPLAPSASSKQAASAKMASSPAFSPADVAVIFVLGGPGAGKGTQSAKLVSKYGFTHLSAGDLLRAEQNRDGSEFGDLIKACIRDGAIVPMEVTVKLIEKAMRETLQLNAARPTHHDSHDVTGIKGKFLIDGFPRKMDQADMFEQSVCPARFVLFYDCPEDELQRRLIERGKTSGRADDNPESIRKRFSTFVETSMPVVDRYDKEGRVVKIMGKASVEDVFKETEKQLKLRLGHDL